MDEDVSDNRHLRMHGGKTPVPFGRTYLRSWSRRLMVKQQNTKKTKILGLSADGPYLGKYLGD
jgi:hypothetical protein